jgi:hypothetical protein
MLLGKTPLKMPLPYRLPWLTRFKPPRENRERKLAPPILLPRHRSRLMRPALMILLLRPRIRLMLHRHLLHSSPLRTKTLFQCALCLSPNGFHT